MQRPLLTASVAIVMGFVASAYVLADERPELAKIDRHIGKEPRYTGKKPLYGLFIFGPKTMTHVWAELDKSQEGKDEYDTLYFDSNANGDLTEPGERWTGPGPVKVGAFRDPATGDVHEKLTLSWRPDGSVRLHMTWKVKEPVLAGCGEHLGPYCRFAESPENAPILWPGAEEPLEFQSCDFAKELRIGGRCDVFVYLGHHGMGSNTFCAVTQEFLPPEIPVVATVIYKDGEGKERRSQSELRERC